MVILGALAGGAGGTAILFAAEQRSTPFLFVAHAITAITVAVGTAPLLGLNGSDVVIVVGSAPGGIGADVRIVASVLYQYFKR